MAKSLRTEEMAATGGAAQVALAWLVAILLLVVLVLGLYVYFRTHTPQAPRQLTVDLRVPATPLPDGPKMPKPPIPQPK